MFLNDVSSVDFWDDRYKTHNTGWDLGTPTPIFLSWLAEHPAHNQRVCVLGAGSGYDAIAFARQGYIVTAVDFAPTATALIQTNADEAEVNIDVITGDLFDLPETHADAFDLVVEYTTYCAIDPGRRDEYIEVVSKLVGAEKRFLALFWPVNKLADTGPPFRVTRSDIEDRFSKYFELESQLMPDNSAEGRQGKEILAEYRRK
ncbi:methyltransferase domain-containing protein [Candidatus Neomarinimicrobiota bacterium]